MAFKGTRRRSARRIAEEIEQVGGDINAATSVEQTSYNVRVLGEDVTLGLDILSDILTEPAFAPEELEREKNVIVQEIGSVLDTPDDLVFDLFQEQAYAGQAIGRSILGTRRRCVVSDVIRWPPIWRAPIAGRIWWSPLPGRWIMTAFWKRPPPG